MAKQKGIIKLEGTLGDITFLKTRDGYLAKENNPPSAARIATDPAFARTRENASEFGRAGKAGKLLRTALRMAMQNAKDSRVTSRLTAEMIKVIQADSTSTRGQRNVIDGEAALLEGFNFNNNAVLSSMLFASYNSSIDRAAGTLTVNIPAFVPANMITYPAGSTHFKICANGCAVDFENENFESDFKETAILPLNNNATAVINLNCAVTANSTHPLFLAMGIQFYQEVNGTFYPLKDGGYNGLELVKVEGV
jgi:hypothetical protein